MKDRITETEWELEYSRAVEIAQEWALEAKFAVHEMTDKRILFSQNNGLAGIRWVLIERLSTKIKLSAWFAPKSLGPDQEGNFWKGNKQPIPTGIGFGQIGRFKKDFNKLLEQIGADSNGPSVSSTIQKANQPVFSKDNLAKGLMVLAILIFLNSAMSIFTGTQMLSNQLLPDFAESLLQDAFIEMAVGIVLFVSAQLLKKGKSLSIWLYGATLLFSVVYDLAIGANFPFFTMLFGLWIMSQLLALKKQGELV